VDRAVRLCYRNRTAEFYFSEEPPG
jgi:hypothetical protein